ncbi:hypothetical protein RclHR1_15410004 [Rhizophagus clarus]|uniref:WW domain protein n=1 Tax=Rhizophagus clarus TaxID=94130 RepID=A0A2Z6QSI5_9GLOM|nr:hypothetical protein RclHR1_15410004 [Rhizophagus clarus]GES99617.1 WW domain protein [Rhizophagus clarus]
MSSTQLTNSGFSDNKVVDTEEEKPKDSNELNDISTFNAQDQEGQSEEIQKDKVLEITEERKNVEENVNESQQNNVDNHNVSDKNESNQEQELGGNLISNDVNTNEIEQISEENKDQSTLSVWSAVWDDNVQGYYYWNTLTNETTWENPYNNLMAQNVNHDYSQHDYYYSQYGYYPEAYYYGYDHSALTASSDMTTTTAVTTTEPPTNPLESILDRIDKEVKTKLDGNSSKAKKSSSIQYNDQQDQTEQHEKDENVENVEQTSLISSSADLDTYYDQNQMTTNDSDYQSFLAEHGGNDGGDYKLTARFNARTGKFQRDPTLNPEKFSAESKAIRQMSYFFDYDQFAESRGSSASNKRLSSDASLGDSIKSPKKLNKKDIEMFKQKKKEKKDMKKKSWLLSDD